MVEKLIGGLIEYTKKLGIKKVLYPVDRRNIASKKIPLYYGGKFIEEVHEVKKQSGETLEVETYALYL